MNTQDADIKPSVGKQTLKVAVTGSAGSGKSSVCERLKQLGALVVSSDDLAREAVAPGTTALKRIARHFGAEAINADGTLNRQHIRQIIVSDASARKKLEAFVHPEIAKRIRANIAAAEKEKRSVVIVEVPLLFELAMEKQFDAVLLVLAERKQRVERLVRRDHVTIDEAEALLNLQMPDTDKVAKSDYVIHNDDTPEKLQNAVDAFYREVFKKY